MAWCFFYLFFLFGGLQSLCAKAVPGLRTFDFTSIHGMVDMNWGLPAREQLDGHDITGHAMLDTDGGTCCTLRAGLDYLHSWVFYEDCGYGQERGMTNRFNRYIDTEIKS